MPKLPDKSIDMVLCDLPYGTTACKWDVIIPFEPLWEQYERIIKDNGAIVLFASQPFTSTLIVSNIRRFKYCWVWEKGSPTGHLNAKHQPMRRTEDIAVFYAKPCTYNPQGLVWNPRIKSRDGRTHGSDCYGSHGDRNLATWQGYPTNLLRFQGEHGSHPTQKPVPLCEYLILTYTNEGETVLDNCMGSGTTGVACYNTNRKFIGIEINPKYFRIAKERIEKATAQLKIEF